MDDPAPAAWLAAGPNTVSGRSRSLSSVTVNGVDMTQNTDAETWSGAVTLDRGVSLLTAVGTEGDGDTLQAYAGVIAGEYGDPGLSVEDAIALRVNESGLQELMGLVTSCARRPWGRTRSSAPPSRGSTSTPTSRISTLARPRSPPIRSATASRCRW
jgi:hypothetical protein